MFVRLQFQPLFERLRLFGLLLVRMRFEPFLERLRLQFLLVQLVQRLERR